AGREGSRYNVEFTTKVFKHKRDYLADVDFVLSSNVINLAMFPVLQNQSNRINAVCYVYERACLGAITLNFKWYLATAMSRCSLGRSHNKLGQNMLKAHIWAVHIVWPKDYGPFEHVLIATSKHDFRNEF